MIKIVPFFPDSPALEKKWWHRLMKVISTLVVVISGIGAAICFVLVLINTYAIVAGPGLIFRFTNTKTIKIYKKWGWKIDTSRGENGYITGHWIEWPDGVTAKSIYLILKRK